MGAGVPGDPGDPGEAVAALAVPLPLPEEGAGVALGGPPLPASGGNVHPRPATLPTPEPGAPARAGLSLGLYSLS